MSHMYIPRLVVLHLQTFEPGCVARFQEAGVIRVGADVYRPAEIYQFQHAYPVAS